MELPLIEKAISLAVLGHREQFRKHGNVPYVVHPMMVAIKLLRFNEPDAVVAAALVHDLLEDTFFTEQELLDELGEEVLSIVKGVTENKKLPWKERKIDYIEKVKNSSHESKLVSLSDKVHNVENVLYANHTQGDAIWEKFGAGKEGLIWFETEMVKMFNESELEHPLFEEYKELVLKVKQL